ncbi:AfsR/SARP family transcriptional regulator [Actinophytocola sp.]|uniref:AfsR/SARP family transcriptional regulator n=1 Tax=Actinophytocola sp. TaxID=1872138 RepID=UPI002D7ED5B1|nr:AfsR/SARP family transcriptional regulator [Actinophytocola sp.]HET9143335.1 AfsR/SARP family transcriptional regulator [Actinophytocola sp.]
MITSEVSFLGPLDIRVNGRSVVPTAKKLRQVLALLAVHAGRLVTVPELIEELWGTKVPRTAIQTIQTYILKLRQKISEHAPAGTAMAVLTTRPGGYLLDVAPGQVDAHRYQELADAGERAFAADDFAGSSRLLGKALGCWRGPALVDVPFGIQLSIEATRLDQGRLGVLETQIESDLRLGRHHQLLGELAELTARYPMHEKLCGQYMTALHASGMKWRALEAFQTLRGNLVHELGVEPSLQVRDLQQAILNSDELHAPQLVS